jgi:hypothetical protein
MKIEPGEAHRLLGCHGPEAWAPSHNQHILIDCSFIRRHG